MWKQFVASGLQCGRRQSAGSKNQPRIAAALGLSTLLGAELSQAATLPPHDALRIIVVGDAVNPHGLSDAELTQPEDLAAAIGAGDSGIAVSQQVPLVNSQCVDDALTALTGSEPPDVVVYFAHRAARGCDGVDRQVELTAGLVALLESGGGLVVFHHGLYVATGKEEILQLIGAESDSIEWNTQAGQRVYDVAPGHFVTSNGIEYAGTAALSGVAGVATADYGYFDNVPDERYPVTRLLDSSEGVRTLLFATDSGPPRALGFVTSRPGWQGRIVAYQPGENQPLALDDRDGNNFQVLANAILYSTGFEPDAAPGPSPSGPEPAPTADGSDAGGPEPAPAGSPSGEPAPSSTPVSPAPAAGPNGAGGRDAAMAPDAPQAGPTEPSSTPAPSSVPSPVTSQNPTDTPLPSPATQPSSEPEPNSEVPSTAGGSTSKSDGKGCAFEPRANSQGGRLALFVLFALAFVFRTARARRAR